MVILDHYDKCKNYSKNKGKNKERIHIFIILMIFLK